MRVELDIDLDLNGMHTFDYRPSQERGALEIPKAQLQRWQSEYESFQVAYLRWRRMAEEIEEFALKAQKNAQRAEPGSNPHQKNELERVIQQKVGFRY